MRLQNINNSAFMGMVLAGATLSLLIGCSKRPQETLALAAQAPMMAAATVAVGQPAKRRDTLAYEHSVSVELDRRLVPTRLREIETACASGKPVECTVLEVTLHGQEDVFSGLIRMRIAPQGVDATIEAASQGGKLTARNTRAEDLAQPMEDTQRKLALMTTHRDRLAEIMKSKELKIEQLITVSKELATVQTEIDALSTTQAQLRRRVDTDLLTINLSPPRVAYFSQHTPIRDAFRAFGSNFREALGDVIYFIAVVAPWLVIGLPGLFLLRVFWLWINRTLARRKGTLA
jgi:hypothetical protein